MAKVLYGAGTIDQRNKIAGWVYSKNRYGNYIRQKVTPVNPQTQYQSQQRQILGNLSGNWRGLTEAQRDSWVAAAPSFPVTDVFGNSMVLAANALYIALNKNLTNAGIATITTAPSPVSIDPFSITAFTGAAGTPSLNVTINPAALPSDTTLFVYATPNVPTGINFVKNRYRFIGTGTPSAGVVDILTIWQNRFGTLQAGKKVFVKLALVSNLSGQQSVPVTAVATIAA